MQADLDYVFGPSDEGGDQYARARLSSRIFARSQDHLALATPDSKGHKLTAIEALDAFGLDKLREVLDYGSAILPPTQDEPASTLRQRRESLGLSIAELVNPTGLTAEQIEDCENPATRSPVKSIIRLAEILGLDERVISSIPGAQGDESLAVRLKTMGGAKSLSPSAVVTLSEASWIVKTEWRLRDALQGTARLLTKFETSDNYGQANYPAWKHGYYLARRTRARLGIGDDDTIPSVRDVCAKLGFPLLQAKLPKHIAGATVVSNGRRGIAVNTAGRNSNVWVRRATMAHELGHALWDADEKLNRVRVDAYEDLERISWEIDAVEARANAFAIAFLAPLEATATEFQSHSSESVGLRAIMERFGISFTAAKFHVGNAIDRSIGSNTPLEVDTEPTIEWEGRELFSVAAFPIQTTSDARRGEFAGLVVAARRAGLISIDTASDYLQTTPEILLDKEDILASIFSK